MMINGDADSSEFPASVVGQQACVDPAAQRLEADCR
jgi:hypothetical protein